MTETSLEQFFDGPQQGEDPETLSRRKFLTGAMVGGAAGLAVAAGTGAAVWKISETEAQVSLEAADFGHDPLGVRGLDLFEYPGAGAHGHRHDDEVGVGRLGERSGLVERDLPGRRIDHPHPVPLAGEKAAHPPPHPSLAADHDRVESVSGIHRVAQGRLLLDRLLDQESSQFATEPRVEPEQRAGLLEPAVDPRLDAEVAKRHRERSLEVADLAGELEAFADQVEDAAIEGLDVPAVLVEELASIVGQGRCRFHQTSVRPDVRGGAKSPPSPAGL